MTIQKFIEKAIGGGWKEKYLDRDQGKTNALITECVLLDALAWQAVGKVEGWKETVNGYCGGDPDYFEERNEKCCWFGRQDCEWFEKGWQFKMHRMIDALAEGTSIEDFIATL